MRTLALPLTATIAIQIVASFVVLAGPVIAPIAAPELGVDPARIGMAIAAMYASAALSCVTCPAVIARIGPLRTSQLCLVIAASAAVTATLDGVASAIFAHLLAGIAYGPVTPASSQILQRLSPPQHRNFIFSVKQTGVPAGYVLTGLILPSAALAFGWRSTLLVTAGLCVALALAVQPLRAMLDAERNPALALVNTRQVLDVIRTVLGDTASRALVAVGFTYNMMQATVTTFLVVYLTDAVGQSVVAAGAILAAAQTGAAGARLMLGWLADRITAARVLIAIGVGMTVCTLVVCLFTAQWPVALIAVVCVAWGVTSVGWNGVMIAEVARLAPPGRVAQFTGGTSFFSFIGMMAIPAAISAIIGATGSYVPGFLLAAVLSLVGTVAMMHARKVAPS
jgi:MFS family permease